MAEGVTPPVANPESVSRHDGLLDVEPCHAAGTRQTTTKHDIFFELLAEAAAETCHRAIIYYTVNYDFSGFSFEELCPIRGFYLVP